MKFVVRVLFSRKNTLILKKKPLKGEKWGKGAKKSLFQEDNYNKKVTAKSFKMVLNE